MASADESGWTNLGPVGSHIAKQAPEFDARNYGYKRLSDLVIATELFEVEHRSIGKSGSKAMFVKDKRTGS